MAWFAVENFRAASGRPFVCPSPTLFRAYSAWFDNGCRHPGRRCRFAPGYHITALTALKTSAPVAQKIRGNPRNPRQFASRPVRLRVSGIRISAFGHLPTRILNVTVTYKMTGIVVVISHLSRRCALMGVYEPTTPYNGRGPKASRRTLRRGRRGRVVASTFLSAGAGGFPAASSCERKNERETGRAGNPDSRTSAWQFSRSCGRRIFRRRHTLVRPETTAILYA